MRIYTKGLLYDARTVLAVYVLTALTISIQAMLLPANMREGRWYRDFNNYFIFKQSYAHLRAGTNLYSWYKAEYWDLYKYSPSFALAMAPLSYLPDFTGLLAWNMLNMLVLLWGISLLPMALRTKQVMLWFILAELITSVQNAQSNGLMAGLLIAAYAHMERGKPQWATLWLVLATFIKVYGGIGFILFVLYPGKGKSAAWAALWAVLVAALPLLVTTPHALAWQYHNWAGMMAWDQRESYGLSVAGWLHTWFGLEHVKVPVTVAGVLLFLLPLVRVQLYGQADYRLLLLASMLVWVIIFNHKAESPTYIIAVAGVAIWYYARPARKWRTGMLAAVFVLTCLAPTDLYPANVRNSFFVPYNIKVVPCIALWCVMLAELMTMKKAGRLRKEENFTDIS